MNAAGEANRRRRRSHRKGMAMQVTLTESDLAAMPTALRQELLAYLERRRKAVPRAAGRRRGPAGHATIDLAVLDRDQAIALVRNVSFGHSLQGLHDLLKALSYEQDGDAPKPEQLARLLKVEDSRHLRRYFDAIKRLLKRTMDDTAPLARYSRRTGTYLVDPLTRASLREVFIQLARSGEGEEPLWA